jgi:bacillopeptidase F
MEWMMAPTDLEGKNPRPDLAPDVVINSWGGAPVSNAILWTALRNWDRAGVVPIFASGNNRKAQPGQVAVPGMYPEAITVGATSHDDTRAFFSMYGPSPFSKGPKPEVTAPGVMTYSTYPDGTFRDTFIIDGKPYPASGTSMATPHVVGAAALYLQAHPGAKTDQIRQALMGAGTLAHAPTAEMGAGRVQVDKLIAPGSFDASSVKLTDPRRVEQLMDQVKRAKIFNPGGQLPVPAAPDEPIVVPGTAA